MHIHQDHITGQNMRSKSPRVQNNVADSYTELSRVIYNRIQTIGLFHEIEDDN